MRYLAFILVIFVFLVGSSCKKEADTDQQLSDTTTLMPTGLVPATEEELLSLPTIESLDSSLIPNLRSTIELPDSLVLLMPAPGNQGSYNSCVGWAIGYGMLSYYYKFFEGHNDYDGFLRVFSPNYIWNKLNNHNNVGIKMYKAMMLVKEMGCCKLFYMPVTSKPEDEPSDEANKNALNYTITDVYTFSTLNLEQLKLILYRGNPIVIGVSTDQSFGNGDNSLFVKTDDGRLIWNKYHDAHRYNHAMVICGYDDNIQSFKVMNSYGSNFGNDGYIWINYEFFKSIIIHTITSTRYEMYVGLIYRPLIYTSNTNGISSFSATCSGKVAADYNLTVTERGVCWNTTTDPTISDNKKTGGSGTGNFTVTLTGLNASTKYYYKAYAINSAGISYGMEYSFTTTETQIGLPILTTNEVTEPTQTTATSGGNITDDGGATVTSRGVCWSTSENPTTNDNHTSDGTGTGAFTSSITGLTPNTPYYVRAYATNSAGTGYGNQVSFTTSGEETFYIGQEYGGGVIFYIDNTGKHGLIAAMEDQSSGISWYNGSYVITGATGTAIGTGNSNSEKILDTLGNGYLTSYAAEKCYLLWVGYYGDWFLPSKDELKELFNLTGPYALPENNYYWSSTESGGSGFGSGAWYTSKYFSGNGNEYMTARVRAVREF